MANVGKTIEGLGKQIADNIILRRMTPEMQLMVEIESVIYNIVAVTNIDFDVLKKHIMKVGLQASLDYANQVYLIAMRGRVSYDEDTGLLTVGMPPPITREESFLALAASMSNMLFPIAEVVEKLQDWEAIIESIPNEKELARQRSRDDLKAKRNSMRRGGSGYRR